MKNKLLNTIFGLSIIYMVNTNSELLFAKDVYLGGNSIGIEMKKNGVIVSGTYDIIINNKVYNPSKDSNIKIGDIIYEVDNNEIKCSKDFINTISYDNDNNLDLKIKRNNKILYETIKYQKDENIFKTGLYIKDKILGVGTLTYYDPETKNYGALGHEIIDSDTHNIFDDFTGNIVESYIEGYKKSTNGTPGEKIASIDTNINLGNILLNTKYGIYGEYLESFNSKLIETASKEETHLGKAQIATVLNGNKIEYYDINIINLEKQNEISTKGITFEVTDKDLLSKTNGIIQGMSGSPIIQDNKLIGAVTHVLTNEVNKGYGIYIDFMLNFTNNL